MNKNGSQDKPSDLSGQGYSDKSYNPGYPIKKSLTKEFSEDDLKRGYKEGG